MKLRTTIYLTLAACLLVLWAIGAKRQLSAYDLPRDIPSRLIPCPGPILLTDYPPDDPGDWGPSFQQGIADLSDHAGGWKHASGGKFVVPKGQYPVTTPILVDCPGIIIEGCGSPYSHACTIEWDNPDPKAALFTFIAPRAKARRSNGFAIRDIRLIDVGNRRIKKGAKVDTTAFRFTDYKVYTRDFLFQRVSANYFGAVLRVEAEGSCWGGVCCENVHFTYNGMVLDAVRGTVNESYFQGQYHKNAVEAEGWPKRYAFEIDGRHGGDNITFERAILEGMPRALRATDVRNLHLTACRLENNALTPDPVVWIRNSPYTRCVGNYHRVVPAEEVPGAGPTIRLEGCENSFVTPMDGKVERIKKWEPYR